MAILDKAKAACRITSEAYDEELSDLIDAAKMDLYISGVLHEDLDLDSNNDIDPLILRAIITYCKANLGNPENYTNLKAAYDEQKAQLSLSSGYVNWRVCDD